MKRIYSKQFLAVSVCGIVAFLSSSGSFALPAGRIATAPKPYRVAMVLSGNSYNLAQFLGMLAEAEAQSLKPDLIIASCGGSIAAWIAASFSTSESQLEYMRSEAGFNDLNVIHPQFGFFGLLSVVGSKVSSFITDGDRLVPDLHHDTVATMPPILASDILRKSFDEDSGGPDILITSARTLFADNEIGQPRKPGRPYFQETYFGSPRALQWVKSISKDGAVSSLLKKGWVHPDVDVREGVAFGAAVRASVADMYVLPAARIAGETFLTGAINIAPMQIARGLADVVIGRTSTRAGWLEVQGLQNTFGYTLDEQRDFWEREPEKYADIWVDLKTSINQGSEGPSLDLPAVDFSGDAHMVKSGLPATHEQFEYVASNQWTDGVRRMADAIARYRRKKP